MKHKMSFFVRGFALIIVSFVCILSVYFNSSNNLALSKKINNNLENMLYLETIHGRIVIKMLPDVAPEHVKRIKELVKNKFYDGVPFHRVIKDFMVQTGDPTGTGMGGSGVKLKAEFTKKYSHKEGVVSMARANDINSADSQFFIVLKDSPSLDEQYTIWGYVVEGMNVVKKIKIGNEKNNGIVKNPDVILKLSMASDVEDKNSKS